MLQALGLGVVEEAVYRGVLADPSSGIAELSLRLGRTEAQVRAGLDRLVDLDLLRPSRDSPGVLRAVRPELGLEILLMKQEEELARRQQEIVHSKAAAAQLVSEFAELRPNTEVDDAERLVGLDAIQSRLEQLARGLERECLAILPGGALSQCVVAKGVPVR